MLLELIDKIVMRKEFNQKNSWKLKEAGIGIVLILAYIFYAGIGALLNIWFWLALTIFFVWLFATFRSGLVLNDDYLIIRHFYNQKIKYQDIKNLEEQNSSLIIRTNKNKSYMIENTIENYSELVNELKKNIIASS